MAPGQPRCFTRLTIDDDLLRSKRVGFHWWNGSFILTRVITDTPGSCLSARRFLKDQSLTRIDPDWFNRSTMSWRRLVYLLLSHRGFSVAYWFIPGFRVPFPGESSGFSYLFSLNKAFLLRKIATGVDKKKARIPPRIWMTVYGRVKQIVYDPSEGNLGYYSISRKKCKSYLL